MRNKILVVTASDEPNIPDVLSHLTKKEVFRLNTDTIVDYGMTLVVKNGDIEILLTSGQQEAWSGDIKTVWYRRPPKASVAVPEFEELEKKFAESENQRFLRSLWHSFPTENVCWVNHPLVTRRLEHNKPLQLQTAHQAGLDVPETLITNNLDKARDFWESHNGQVIVKAFSSFSQDENGWPIGVYTSVVNREILEDFGHELKYAPVIFQHYVPKKLELRVTVVGKRVLACAIHSQDSERTKDDWRRYDFKNVKHEPYQLPQSTEEKLLSCMRSWGLQFGAIDMIITPDDDYVFLEVNPSGHWGWIESLTGLPISEALAELLADPGANAL